MQVKYFLKVMTSIRFAWLPLLLLACGGPPAPPAGAAVTASGDPALRPFLTALDRLAANPSQPPLAILQIGDSHTANDGFSGFMREAMQQRFGNGGRGFMPPGIPFRYYKPSQIHVEMTGWTTISSFSPGAPPPFGITGLRQHASGPADMSLTVEQPGGLAHVVLEVLDQQGGGTLHAAFDGGPDLPQSTNAALGVRWIELAGGAAATLTLHADGNGPIDILSWSAERQRGGITWSNLGTIGATIDLLGQWEPKLVRAELARLKPALIVIAFGTNEGFRDSTDPVEYETLFGTRIRTIKAAAPNAALMVLGPPDGDKAAVTGDCPEGGKWAEPRNLAPVREAQRRVAARLGAAFWDWSDAMGGRCSMQRWARLDPPFAAPDHVHLFRPGYRATAARLFDTLMADYARYEAAKPRR